MNAPLGLLLFLYAAMYVPFSALTKVVAHPIGALPASVCGAWLVWAGYLSLSGAWTRVRVDRDALWAGLGGAAILCASTVAYGLGGSLVLPLLLMKGGGLAVAPLTDAAQGTAVSRKSALVLLCVAVAVVAGAWHRLRLDGTAATLCCALVYLCGYGGKLAAVGRRRGDWGFFLSETTVTLAVAAPASLLACAVAGLAPLQPLHGLGTLAALAGAFSQGVGVFGGLVLLRREDPSDPDRSASHSALFPLHRASSLLAGMAASFILGCLDGRWAMTWGEGAGGALMACALWVGTRRA